MAQQSQSEWYAKVMGEEWGPMGAEDLQRMARERQLTPMDQVRKGLDGRWVEAQSVSGLFPKKAIDRSQSPPPSNAAQTAPESTPAIASSSATDFDSNVMQMLGPLLPSPRVATEQADQPASEQAAGTMQAQAVANPTDVGARIPWDRPGAPPISSLGLRTGTIGSVLDFQFKRYLTPWIVRMLWALALVIATLYVSLNGCLTVIGMVRTSPAATDSTANNKSDATRESSVLTNVLGFLLRMREVLGFLLRLTLTLVGLLFLRVVFESIIVLFNIAKSLASLDEKASPRGV